jgi:aspartyl-tRNA(Asn)/glutamyl-tRNA(Gln) amidotransferase subunit A
MRRGALTSVQLTMDALQRIGALDSDLSAFVQVIEDQALDAAAAADRAFSEGCDLGPLQGVPYAVKDNIDVAGLRTTCNSRHNIRHLAKRDAAVQARLRASGAVLLGKLNLHEFATSLPSFELPVPPAKNPWNPDYTPGGSSSGCAVAVSSGYVRTAIGTDTGGSIRWPAACCGAVGLKPTRGRVSCAGIQPLAPSLDHCGLIAWTIEDAALTLMTIADPDAQPSWSTRGQAALLQDLTQGVHGLRVALARHIYAEDPDGDPEVLRAVDDAAQALAQLGAVVAEIRLPDPSLVNACGRVIMAAESFGLYENLIRSQPLAFARVTYQKLAAGAAVTPADYRRARGVQQALERQLDENVFQVHDVILSAVAMGPPPMLSDLDKAVPIKLQTSTILANVTGHPALALPLGTSRDGLPFSAQLIGRRWDERGLLRAGRALLQDRAEAPSRPSLHPRSADKADPKG